MELLPAISVPGFDAPRAQEYLAAWLLEPGEHKKPEQPVLDFLAGVFLHSPFLRDCAMKEAAFLCELLAHGFDDTCEKLIRQQALPDIENDDLEGLMRHLRITRRRMALLTGIADLGGWWSDAQVTLALSRFADASVSAALDYLLISMDGAGVLRLADVKNPQQKSGLIVLGMGKLGGFELNYSSDIDLVIFFDQNQGMRIVHDDPVTVLNRMGKQLIKLLQERTSHGYVFRTDLRLRPDPSSTPLVLPVDAALNYYEGQGQNWERSAMIKARPVAGDIEAADRFLAHLAPFIWRKYLDFNAINDVQSIKRQIHAHKGHGEIAVKGHNIKLGRGGIREVEFFAQTQQLIAGGRNNELRCRETEQALNALCDAGWIEPSTRDELVEAYWFLRKVEHRIQMVRDEQTHSLPVEKVEMATIAALTGEAKTSRFEKGIRQVLECVERHYSALFEDASALSTGTKNLVFTGDDDDPETLEALASLGFRDASETVKTIKLWHVAKFPALQTTTARELLTELVPFLLETIAKTGNPDSVLSSFDRFVSGLPAGIQLFSILKNNPELTVLLVRILDTAPRLADQISRKPHVFDLLLDAGSVDYSRSHETDLSVLNALTQRAGSFEEYLDAIRQYAAEARFGIGTKLFSGEYGWQEAAESYSRLAEVLIGSCFSRVAEEFSCQHGTVAGARVCVLAMGRLGSRELTAASDLDLIFLYDLSGEGEMSDGARPLDPTLYHARLIQRFITAMTAPTAEGILYPLDFRLRPSGNAGPLATSVKAFVKYQQNDAWVWEAQALTRGRPIFGDASLCDEINQGVADILDKVADRHDVKPEIRKMRKLIDKEKGDRNPWNVKSIRGGLLDIEFIAQWLVLSHPDLYRGLTSTYQILAKKVDIGDDAGRSGKLLDAFSTYSTVIHLMRACLGDVSDPNEFPGGFESIMCQKLDLPTLKACEAHLMSTQEEIREIFDGIFG